MAGIEGSIRYNNGPHQYSQGDMWSMALGLVPRLMINRLRYGRFLDVLVTHAPPWKIHDMEDLPHHGIKAFRWLLQVFKPAYHLHGHIHVYRNDIPTITQFEETQVINCYGYRELTLEAKINPNHRLFRRLREVTMNDSINNGNNAVYFSE